ncbi:MAG: type II methionyl aminopeptidase [Candidatus Thermoplasmatota archaeon]|nr:type II methionyl aminopeptidase [Candidatus Thermoplasmatota archaeon]MCL5984516.1 type II methionyl aminopeptidase [Candidatus Thermoplasmatota archaeon]
MTENVEAWRKAGLVGARALHLGASLIRPGTSLLDVAEEIEGLIRKEGCLPSFPVNISLDNEAAHFTPPPDFDRRFEKGQVVKLDVGAQFDGYVSDNATTVEVGAQKYSSLVSAAREALDAAERVLHGDMTTDQVTRAIEGAIQRRGFTPIKDLMGHTVERYRLHAGKSVPNSTEVRPSFLEVGEVVAVEPFATNGVGHIRNGPFGNILRFREAPPADSEPELKELHRQFSTLPFCLRWVKDLDLRKFPLRKRPIIQTYPVFLEEAGGWVSQAEATFLLTASGAERLTMAP